MENWNNLKTAISSVVKSNGIQGITGDSLQSVMLDMVTKLGENYMFAGVATPTTTPGTPDGNVFYFAVQAGTYVNFGGLEIKGGFNIIKNNTSGGWVLSNVYELTDELGDSETAVMSQKAVTDELQNTNAFTIVGKGETLLIRRIGTSLPIGIPLRIYVKNVNVDYTGININIYSYDRFAILAKDENDETIETLFKVAMDTKYPLNPYYDVTLPEGTKYITITMRAAEGFEQSIWLSGVSVVDNINDGGMEQPLSAEQGKVLGELQSKIRLIGADDTYVRSNYIKGLTVGHIYRIMLNPNIDLSGITVTGAGYDLFNVILYSDDTFEDKSIPVRISVKDTLASYYDIIIPEGYDYAMNVNMRATAGAEQIITIEDITAQIDNIRASEELKLISGEAVELTYNADNVFLSEKQISVLDNDGDYTVGENVSNLPTLDNANCKNIIIDLPAPDKIAWLEIHNHYNTTLKRGSLLTDENNIVTNILLNRNHIADNMAVIVPPGSKRLILGIFNNILPTIICHPFSEVDRLVNDNYGAEEKITSFLSLSSLQSQGYNFNNDIIGQSLFTALTVYDSDAYVYLVPLWGYKTLRAIHFKTGSAYGSAFVDENMKIVGSLIKKGVNYLTDYINIPEGAKFLCYVDYKTITQERYIELFNSGTAEETVDNLESYVNGDIVDGSVIYSRTSLLLPVIPMDKGFHITLNEGYEFKSAHLYYNGSIVCTDYHPNPRGGDGNIASPFEYFDYRVFSMNQILPQLSIRLVVIKSDGSEISPSELFIKEKTVVNYTDFKRLEVETIPAEKNVIARRRINQFLNLVWKAEEDIYPSNPNDYLNTHFKKGRTYISSIYSETSEYSKYLGWCVSFRTYLTSLMNKRSVMYTERISQGNNKSEYGISYAGLDNYYCNPYYGTVCTGLTQYALNLPNLYISGTYHSGGVPNTTKINNADSSNVQPLDYLWNSGHCSIISDILLDENGNRKFIVWAEQTFPVAKNTVYTLEEFDERCRVKEIEVWRYSNWDTVVEPEPTPYIQSSKWEWQTPLVVDKDFHLFCGDYAAFAKGDPIFFNANRGTGYSRMTVYNEEDDAMSTALITLDLSSLDNDGMYSEDGEDWVKIDFTSNSLPAGKYKARLASDTAASGFVHFEIVELDLSASLASDSNSTDISYSCSDNGVPVLIRQERKDGMYTRLLIISDNEKEKDVNVSWKSYDTYKFIKLYVKADYGMVIKRINMSEQTE